MVNKETLGMSKNGLFLELPCCIMEAWIQGNTLDSFQSTFNFSFHTVTSFTYLTSGKNSMFVNAK